MGDGSGALAQQVGKLVGQIDNVLTVSERISIHQQEMGEKLARMDVNVANMLKSTEKACADIDDLKSETQRHEIRLSAVERRMGRTGARAWEIAMVLLAALTGGAISRLF